MEAIIKNSWELKEEIVKLSIIEKEQAAALVVRVNSPGAVFSAVYSIFTSSKPQAPGSKNKKHHQDFVSIISRFLIPLTLNKTLFRNSGFIVKALVGLVSQKASGFVNEDSVVSLWDKAKRLFIKKNKKLDQRYPYGL